MPYILSPLIDTTLPGLWGEGAAYEQRVIYDIWSSDPKAPPVNYCSHTLKPHSMPHIDFAAHILAGGAQLEEYFTPARIGSFFGAVTVLKLQGELQGEKWQECAAVPGVKVWRVSSAELLSNLERACGKSRLPDRLFLTAASAPINRYGLHDEKHVLVLSPECAELLVSNAKFSAYGTSWKSSDFEPGSRERPVHKILLRQAVLFECLKLDHVPEGEYFLSGFPLALKGASESPVIPVLYGKSELLSAL